MHCMDKQDIDSWTISEFFVTPSGGHGARIFSRSPCWDIPESVEAVDMYCRLLDMGEVEFAGKTLKMEVDAPCSREIIPILSLIVQHRSLILKDRCAVVSVRQAKHPLELDPRNPTGWYGRLNSSDPLQMTLLLDAAGKLHLENGKPSDYLRTIVHELGYGATAMADKGVLEAVYRKYMAVCVPEPGSSRYGDPARLEKIMWKLRNRFAAYETKYHTRELAADLWLLRNACISKEGGPPEDWDILCTAFPDFERLLKAVVDSNRTAPADTALFVEEAEPEIFVEYSTAAPPGREM